jgi:hypothetical protein
MANVMLAIIGIVCALVLLFMIVGGNYDKIFNISMISGCSTIDNMAGYKYLSDMTTLSQLLVILNSITIALFAFILILSVCKLCCQSDPICAQQ